MFAQMATDKAHRLHQVAGSIDLPVATMLPTSCRMDGAIYGSGHSSCSMP